MYYVGVYVVLSQSRLIGVEKKVPRNQLFVVCRLLLKEWLLTIRKIFLGVTLWRKKLGNTALSCLLVVNVLSSVYELPFERKGTGT